ncbi:MAG: 4Fe-4S dicluster domain-containing protein [Deltaproteobacteria bacterium]|nr:4Fe-4S dicluster domain-containing protein [Deltaproteobacteria bacterium]
MAWKYLVVDFEKCTGCRACEIACSLAHNKGCNPYRSSITVIKWEKKGLFVPMVCQQCETAPCEDVCPTGALFRNNETGAMVVDHEKCIGCRMCITACPFGGPSLDIKDRKINKCDLCDGDPTCVKFCETKALEYIPLTKMAQLKKRAGAQKLAKALDEITIK